MEAKSDSLRLRLQKVKNGKKRVVTPVSMLDLTCGIADACMSNNVADAILGDISSEPKAEKQRRNRNAAKRKGLINKKAVKSCGTVIVKEVSVFVFGVARYSFTKYKENIHNFTKGVTDRTEVQDRVREEVTRIIAPHKLKEEEEFDSDYVEVRIPHIFPVYNKYAAKVVADYVERHLRSVSEKVYVCTKVVLEALITASIEFQRRVMVILGVNNEVRVGDNIRFEVELCSLG